MINWSAFYGTQPGYEQIELGENDGAQIGIHEAIYLAQRATRSRNNQVYIDACNEDTLNFPNPVPSTLIEDVHLDFHLNQDSGINYQLNPLLSPSMDLYREEVPSFFKNSEKYLTTRRYTGAELDRINQIDRVAITGVSFEKELGEPLTTAMVSMYLRQQGYIVDPFNESLATPNNGHPDLFAVKLPKYQQTLADQGITDGGFYLTELELPEFCSRGTQTPDQEEVAVLEIESVRDGSFYDAKDETADYLTGGWFDIGYGVRGFAEDRLESWRNRLDVGFITFDKEGEFTVFECPTDYGQSRKTAEVKERVRTIVKLVLLKNLPLDETMDFLDVNSFYDTVPVARNTDLDEVLSRLRDAGAIPKISEE